MKWFSTWIYSLHCTPSLKLLMVSLTLWNQVLAPEYGTEGPPWSCLCMFFQFHLSTHAFFTPYSSDTKLLFNSSNPQSSFSSPRFQICSHLYPEPSSPAPSCQRITLFFLAQFRCHVFRKSPQASQGCSMPLFCASVTVGTGSLGSIFSLYHNCLFAYIYLLIEVLRRLGCSSCFP